MAQQTQHTVADQVRRCLLAAYHGNDHVGDHLFFSQPGAFDLSAHQRLNQAVARVFVLFADGGSEVRRHLLHAAQHARNPVGVVLEVAQYFGEISGPRFQLLVIAHRHSHQFRGNNGRHRLCQISD